MIFAGVERRLHPRQVIERHAEFIDLEGLAVKLCYHVCVLVDISLCGARVRSRTKYTENENMELKLELYDSAKKIHVRGRISRVNPLPDGWYEYGVAFGELPESKKHALSNDLAYVARCK